MEEVSEFNMKCENNEQYAALQSRCEKTFDISSQSHQTFYRLLSALTRDGLDGFIKYGQEFSLKLIESIATITNTAPIHNLDRLLERLTKTVECIEADAAIRPKATYQLPTQKNRERRKTLQTMPILPRPRFPSPPHSPTHSEPSADANRARPNSAPARRWSLSARKKTISSATPSPRSTETSPRSFWGKLASPKGRSKKIENSSPREEKLSPKK